MTANAVAQAQFTGSRSSRPIAPWLHTVLFIFLFLVMTGGGAFFQHRQKLRPEILQPHPHVAGLYLSLIVMEWALVFYVWRGLRRTGTSLREVIGGRWGSAKDVAVDASLGIGLWIFWLGAQMAWIRWMPADRASSIGTLLPQRAIEIVLWVLLSISAGICEEIVFRGYFQQQFKVLARSGLLAVLLQAILFGISHSYQGLDATIRIAIFGALFGLLAMWRKSLRPGMIAHAWTDIFSGILGV
ncbi:MAG: CPBP family intramembrane glutamic endopeptidase [Candidatus Acidiferrales bacterium]